METNILILKLDGFIRKYYKNQLFRGVIYSLGIGVLTFILVALIEYLGNFNTTTRGILFFSLLSVLSFVLINYIIIPATKLYKLGKVISYEDASKIIGTHFSNVKDKLLNTLQLIEMNQASSSSQLSLLTASIDQKVTELKPIPFTSAIDYNENRKYLKYALIPLLLLLGIWIYNSKIISSSTERLVNFNQEYLAPAPFHFFIENEKLETIQNEDYTLNIKVEGNAIPDEAYISINNTLIKLEKKDKVHYSYTFKNMQKDVDFKLKSASVSSPFYTIKTTPKPLVMDFFIDLDYPSYTQKQDDEVQNVGTIIIPEGTKATWNFKTKNTQSVHLLSSDSALTLMPKTENRFTFEKQFFENKNYKVVNENEFMTSNDTMPFVVQVVKDQYPKIKVIEHSDTSNSNIRYFSGEIMDDYGFKNLCFHYKITSVDSTGEKLVKVNRQSLAHSSTTTSSFTHYIDFNRLNLKLGDKIEYYFVVSDNDQINGSKSTRSITKTFKAPTKKELEQKIGASNSEIKKDFENIEKRSEKFQKDIEQLKKDLLNKKQADWQDKAKMKEILKQQQSLKQQLEQLKQQNQHKNQLQEKFNQQQNEEIKQKQEQLDKLLEELNNEESKKLLEELEKHMDKMDKNQMFESLEKMDLSNLDMKKELERALEHFKQLEMDEKLEKTSKELEELAKKQEELANEKESSEEKQKELNEEFEELKEKLDDIEKLNQDLENKRDTEKLEELEKQTQEQMQNAQQQLQKNQQNKANQSQQKASDKMKEMAKEMSSMQQGQSQEQLQENIEDLRALLENLIQTSFDQEANMEGIKKTQTIDPKFVKLGQEQRRIKDNTKVIEDSLFALSKRIIEIEPFVNKEMNKIQYHVSKAIQNIENRQKTYITRDQQYAMTSYNNLALMLDEAMQSMQKQAGQKMPGQANCNKPGGGKASSPSLLPKLQQQQGELGEKMKGMKKGEKGQSKKGNGQNQSKELSKMAGQQAQIREKLKELSEKFGADGNGINRKINDLQKNMEKIEEDIINKNINNETIERQNRIMNQLEEIRLLESEKAKRERDQDEKRESKTAKEKEYEEPAQLKEYKKKKQQEIELLKSVSPLLKPYYKEKVNQYLDKVTN